MVQPSPSSTPTHPTQQALNLISPLKLDLLVPQGCQIYLGQAQKCPCSERQDPVVIWDPAAKRFRCRDPALIHAIRAHQGSSGWLVSASSDPWQETIVAALLKKKKKIWCGCPLTFKGRALAQDHIAPRLPAPSSPSSVGTGVGCGQE